MIPKIIDADAMKDLLWILLNTTYLEAQWNSPFGKPFDDDFTKLDGQKKKVKMLSRRSNARFADLPDYQVAELEMAKSTLRAYVVLPKNAGQFEALQADTKSGIWTESTWNEILSSLKSEQGLLSMPKFTFEYGVEMKEDGPVTNAMGLNFLFKNSARFDEMDSPNSPPSKVGIIKQNTKIEWDENGVKAAAATLVGGVTRASIPRDVYVMTVDRPFYIAIHDSQTAAFMFLGQVIDPK
jgi:serpin B